jgi:tetratricopeptide (TPR) repeat protein
MPISPKRIIPTLLLFLFAFEFALLGLNPSFYMDDSPEIITAAASLGVAHPPGYPLYTLAGRLLSLLPLGPPCLRVNLLAALGGALACALLFGILRDRFQTDPALALPFAFLWMTGATAYPACLSAKNGIYQWTAVFFLAVFTALLRGRRPLAFFLFGLSLANHWMSMMAAGAGFILLAWIQMRNRNDSRKELIRNAAFLIAGLSLYLYLPLRSALDPLVNWGHPVDLGNFLKHVSRYVDKNKDLSADPFLWIRQGFFYLRSSFLEFSGLGLLSLIGMAAAWRENRRQAAGLLLSWAGLLAAVCVFSKFSSQKSYLMQNYSIASFIFIPLFAALGFRWILRLPFFRRPGSSPAAVFAAWMLVLFLAFSRLFQGGQEFYTYTYDYLLNAWRSVPRGGLFFCKGDVLDFPAWYCQLLEGKRPDIPVLGGGSLPMDWYRIDLARAQPGLKVPYPLHEKGKEYISGDLIKWMVDQNPGRRYFFTYPDLKADGLGEMRLAPNGLTQEGYLPPAQPREDPARAERLWEDMRLRHFREPDDSVDEVSWDDFLKDYAMARLWMAIPLLKRARDLTSPPGHKASALDLSKAKTLYRECLPHLFWAQAWDPRNAAYAADVGIDFLHMGDPGKAGDWFSKAALIQPGYADAYYYGGVAAFQEGDKDKAGKLFQKALEVDPHHVQAAQALEALSHPASPGALR